MNSQQARLQCFFIVLSGIFCIASATAHAATEINEKYAQGIIVKFVSEPAGHSRGFVPTDAVRSGDHEALAAAISHRTKMPFSYEFRITEEIYVFTLGDWHTEARLDELAALVATDPSVVYAETNGYVDAMFVPDDPAYPIQHHYHHPTHGINVETAWDSYTGLGVTVAVLDSGYTAHPDLSVMGGYDFVSSSTSANDGDGRDDDPSDPGDWRQDVFVCPGKPMRDSTWHGTHVGGTVAAVTHNDRGVAGVAFGATHQPVRVLGKCGGTTADLASGIRWAAGVSVSGVPNNPNPAKVLNLSLGGKSTCGGTYQGAIDAARNRGATVVVAAGNENDDVDDYAPANCNGVVTVAAIDQIGSKASYSNFGTAVDLAAPGGSTGLVQPQGHPAEVLSTLNDGTTTPGSPSYGYSRGTSMATPHVAGVAALMYQGAPNMTPDQVETILKNTARSFPGTCSGCGAGIVDATAAVAALPPPNDNFPHAENTGSGNWPGTLAHAFVDGGTSGAGDGQPDVWYSFSRTIGHFLNVNTCGSFALDGLDTVLSVHSDTGVAGTAVNQLALNDDWQGSGGDLSAGCPNSRDSAIRIHLAANEAVLIRVSRFNSSSDGRFVLNIDFDSDFDEDGVPDDVDNCLFDANTDQADMDGDGNGDVCDNCTEDPNPTQCDTNGDDFGNICDADLDNNGNVNSFDLSLMRTSFGQSGVNDADLDCNGSVNSFDLTIMRNRFGRPPGPSGTAAP